MKQYNNYADLITFTRASRGTALRPISYGDELVENGTFDTDVSGWNPINTDISWDASGKMQITGNGVNAYGRVTQNISTTIGSVYSLSLDYTRVSTSLSVEAPNGNILFDPVLVASGSYQAFFVATDTTTTILLKQVNDVNADLLVDNVSVREVLFDQPDGTLTLFNHPTNIPRIEYDADGNRLGLLVEEARTNLITYSNPTNGQWTVAQGTVDENDAASPDGFTSASTYKTNTSNAEHYTEDLVSVTSGTQYTFSVYLKKKGYDTACIRIPAIGFVDNAYFIFNFDTKQITTSVGTMDSYGVEDVGNGWLRAYMVRTANASAGALFRVHAKQPTAFTGDGDSGAYIYNAQVEVGSFMTSPIPTSGSTATRSADVASIGVSEFGFNSSEGTLFVDLSNAEIINGARVLNFDSGSEDNMIAIFIKGSNLAIYNRGDAVTSVNNAIGAIVENTKIAYAFTDDDYVGVGDGVVEATDSSGVLANNISTLHIGKRRSGVNLMTGHIKSIKYYPRRLTNAQLQELTS